MRLICLLLWSFCTLAAQSRRATNKCGLTCYRWEKCMGQLDAGEQRPGQLGDTGIIVLSKCSPLLKGCDCESLLENSKKDTTTTTTNKPTNTRSGSSRFRSSNARLPRKLETQGKVREGERAHSTYTSRRNSKSAYRRHRESSLKASLTKEIASEEKTSTKSVTKEKTPGSSAKSASLSARRSLFPRRFRLRKRL